MSVYIDDAMTPWRGKRWCHLLAIPHDADALHAVADALGLRRAWFQDSPPASWPHYDVVSTKRAAAVRAGAVAIGAKELARLRLATRRTVPEGEAIEHEEGGE